MTFRIVELQPDYVVYSQGDDRLELARDGSWARCGDCQWKGTRDVTAVLTPLIQTGQLPSSLVPMRRLHGDRQPVIQSRQYQIISLTSGQITYANSAGKFIVQKGQIVGEIAMPAPMAGKFLAQLILDGDLDPKIVCSSLLQHGSGLVHGLWTVHGNSQVGLLFEASTGQLRVWGVASASLSA